jgi:hypothetical protein
MNKDFFEAARFFSASSLWQPEWMPLLSAWYEHGPFAFWLVEIHRPACVVELGCHWGFSYFAFCQAIQRHQIPARCHAIDTWQGDEQAGFYEQDVFTQVNAWNEKKYSAFSRLIRSTFDQTAASFSDGSIDLLHIDGLHTYEAVKQDFETWLPKMSRCGVVLFHDTNVRDRNFGVWRLWQELAAKHPHFEFLHGYGLGVLGVGEELPGKLQSLFALKPDSNEAGDVRCLYTRLGEAILDKSRLMVAEKQLAKQARPWSQKTWERLRRKLAR